MSHVINTTASPTVPSPRSSRLLRWIFTIVGGLTLVVLLAVGGMILYMNYVPTNLDTSAMRMSEQGLFRIGYVSQYNPIPINQIQMWTLHVEDVSGQPVENAQIAVDGDMPQHGHGLPTHPQVTRYLGNGDYLVEGLKFHMPGWWIVDFHVNVGSHSDQVRFNLLLK